MFPQRVYHCSCAAFEIRLCLINGHYSLNDIVSKLNEKVNCKRLYSIKCGRNEAVFSCRQHMQFTTKCEKDNDKKRCLKCIRTYLICSYDRYNYTNFTVPQVVKEKKMKLALVLRKI